MTIDDKIGDKELQHDINRVTANISTLSSGEIDKYECLTCKNILPLQQHRKIFIHVLNSLILHLGQHLKNKQKRLKRKGKKQVEPLQSLDLTNKTDGLKQVEDVFAQVHININLG